MLAAFRFTGKRQVLLSENLRRERVTLDELHAALRRSWIVEPGQVRFAVLEENGAIGVVPRPAGGDAPADGSP